VPGASLLDASFREASLAFGFFLPFFETGLTRRVSEGLRILRMSGGGGSHGGPQAKTKLRQKGIESLC